VKDLGMYLDATMSMRDDISHLTSTCFRVLRQISCIQCSLSSYTHTMLITCFVFAWLDYCNAMFTGLPHCDLGYLLAVHNAAARLTSSARKYDHVTPLLSERHWLLVEHRITFKIAVMTCKCVHSVTTLLTKSGCRRLQLPTCACDRTTLVTCLYLVQRPSRGPVFCSG